MGEIEPESTPDDSVEVQIFNRLYRLRRTADPEYLQAVAEVVDERMRNVYSMNRNRPPGELAVLAALQLAHELNEARAELNSQEQQFETKARRLESVLDEKLRELGA